MSSDAGIAAGRWTAAERMRLAGITGVIAALHVPGWALYLYRTRRLLAATSFAGAGTLAYALGVRHAFDADHIAAIDDTARLMLQRGRRPLGVGFFSSLGHSPVVPVLSLAAAGGAMTGSGARALRSYGGIASALAGMVFLLAVAVLNALVLAGLLTRLTGTGGPVSRYASVSDHFELLGYAIVGLFAAAWAAALAWRIGGFERRYGKGRR